ARSTTRTDTGIAAQRLNSGVRPVGARPSHGSPRPAPSPPLPPSVAVGALPAHCASVRSNPERRTRLRGGWGAALDALFRQFSAPAPRTDTMHSRGAYAPEFQPVPPATGAMRQWPRRTVPATSPRSAGGANTETLFPAVHPRRWTTPSSRG